MTNLTHHIDSGVATVAALLSMAGVAVSAGVAQAVPATPDWLSLVIGPFGGLIIGYFFLRHQIGQGKKNEARIESLDAKLIEVLERTASLAGRSDERVAQSTLVISQNSTALDRVHQTLTETNKLLARADQDVQS